MIATNRQASGTLTGITVLDQSVPNASLVFHVASSLNAFHPLKLAFHPSKMAT
jgi:hypothetical protein